MTANEAAHTSIDNSLTDLNDVYAVINHAADNGAESTIYFGIIHALQLFKLRHNGFNVERVNPSRDEYKYLISWVVAPGTSAEQKAKAILKLK